MPQGVKAVLSGVTESKEAFQDITDLSNGQICNVQKVFLAFVHTTENYLDILICSSSWRTTADERCTTADTLAPAPPLPFLPC